MSVRISMSNLLLLALSGLVFVVYFTAAARQTAEGRRADGLGRIAYATAGFPDMVSKALGEVRAAMSGDARDQHWTVPREITELGGFETPGGAEAVPGLVLRATGEEVPGWRLLTGAFALSDGPQNAAVLLTPDHQIARVWRLNEGVLADPAAYAGELTVPPQDRYLVHGTEITADGAIKFVFDGGNTFQSLGACGDLQWARAGNYHHSVELLEAENALWVPRNWGFERDEPTLMAGGQSGFAKIDATTGEVLAEISVGDMAAANPDLGLFGIARLDGNNETSNPREIDARWNPDPWHFNDVEALTPEMAGAFPMFEAGDIMVSARTLNAIWVADPETGEVKWYRVGLAHRQHDPDFQPDGTITIFDNRMGLGRSDIIAVNPATNARTVIFDGSALNFYTNIRGKVQLLPGGGMAMTSPQQGRVLEVNAAGAPVFEAFNLKPGSGSNYVVTEVLWLPPEALSADLFACGD